MAKARKSPERDMAVDWRRRQGPKWVDRIHREVIRQLAAGAACSPDMAGVLLETADGGEGRDWELAIQLIVECVGARGRRW